MVPQMPFAENGRGVPARFAKLAEGHLSIVNAVAVFGAQRADNPKAVRVTAREQGRARRRADGLGHIEISEADPFFGHAVEVGRREPPRAIASDVAVALVV